MHTHSSTHYADNSSNVGCNIISEIATMLAGWQNTVEAPLLLGTAVVEIVYRKSVSKN